MASPGPTPAGPPASITLEVDHGPRTTDALALTFHGAGDPTVADGVLRVLERFGAPSTVFAVGTWLDTFPHMGRRILDGGHDLGNHTYQHLPMGALDAATAYSQIARGSAAIMRCTGQAARWFRPSGIVHATPRILAAANRAGFEHCIGYDVDPADYTDPGARLVTARTLRSARAGAIVSLHLGHAGTLTALPAVLRGLDAMHLEAVPLTVLLSEIPA